MSPVETVRWDEDNTKYQEQLLLSADSFRPERLFDIEPSLDWRTGVLSPGGNFAYHNRILPMGNSLDLNMSPSKDGVVWFDGDVVIPSLFDVTGGYPDPWMSLTPKEVITQRPGIRRAHGTVLVGGLGLGWFFRKVHDRAEVERVILVEASQELLDWYGHDLCDRLPKVTDVICGDVWSFRTRCEIPARHLEGLRGVPVRRSVCPMQAAIQARLGLGRGGDGGPTPTRTPTQPPCSAVSSLTRRCCEPMCRERDQPKPARPARSSTSSAGHHVIGGHPAIPPGPTGWLSPSSRREASPEARDTRVADTPWGCRSSSTSPPSRSP